MRKWRNILVLSCLCVLTLGTVTAYGDVEKSVHTAPLVAAPADYSSIAVSQVTDYVNIRQQPTTNSGIVGKIYNNCAATILETVEGEGGTWYRIQSGTVNGFIKAQYFITGEAAEQLAQSIGREFVTINTDSLRLREQPNLESNTLTLLSMGARYVVQGEEGEFFKVQVDADLEGYIAQSYCKIEVEFDQAVSLEEEQERLQEEAQRRKDAETAIAALEQVIQIEANTAAAEGSASGGTSQEFLIAAHPGLESNSETHTGEAERPRGETQKSENIVAGNAPLGGAGFPESGNPSGNGSKNSGSESKSSVVVAGSGGPASEAVVSAARTAVVAYAKQFLGNPYMYGGTSLTDGADCSGFVQQVFKNFGITTGRSSRDQAENVKEISLSEIQPGDLLFYASGNYINHVAIYIGDGKVIHASNPTTGICISPANYRTPCKAGTFLD